MTTRDAREMATALVEAYTKSAYGTKACHLSFYDRELIAAIAAAIEKDRAERDSALDDLLARYPATITEWAEAIRTLRTEIAEER